MFGNPICRNVLDFFRRGRDGANARKESAQGRSETERILGIAQDGARISFALLVAEGEGVFFAAFAQILTEEDGAFSAAFARRAAEEAERFLAKEGAEGAGAALALPAEQFSWRTARLPVSVAPDAKAQARERAGLAHFALQSQGVFTDEFRSAAIPQGENTLMAGIRSEIVERVARHWREAGFPLTAVAAKPAEIPMDAIAGGIGIGEDIIPIRAGREAVWDDGLRAAAYAAYAAFFADKGMAFPLAETRGEKGDTVFWRRAGTIVIALTGIFFFGATMQQLWAIFSLESRLDEKAREAAIRQEDLEKLRALSERETNLRLRTAELSKRSQEGLPLYSLLVYLGAETTDGVYLTGLQRNAAGDLEISGRAASYASFGKFLQAISAESAIFPAGAALKEAVREEDGAGVRFLFTAPYQKEERGEGQ